jgi:hypothetical protein
MSMEKDVYWLRVKIYGFFNLPSQRDVISIDFSASVLKYFLHSSANAMVLLAS